MGSERIVLGQSGKERERERERENLEMGTMYRCIDVSLDVSMYRL